MIPSLMFYGVVAGRWWIVGAAAVAWPIVLVQGNVMTLEPGLLGAALLAAANTAVGVVVHKAVAATGRAVFRLLSDGLKTAAHRPKAELGSGD